ncbi:MAG: response regulator transcription factor [Saprospiraceae bacterium]|nr:response regulator transcription factor [Saprospiraceae bacterium]
MQTSAPKYQYILDLFRLKIYKEGGQSLNFDNIKRKYQLFPHEMLYMVDCKHAQMEPLSANFHKVLGIDHPHKNDLGILYENIHEDLMDVVLQWVSSNIRTCHANAWAFEREMDVFRCVYLTTKQRIILKTVSILSYDDCGTVRFTLGKLTDLTGLFPFQYFTREYEGPNGQLMFRAHQKISRSKSDLTTRESEILELIGQGRNSIDIAKTLFISNHTVDTHRRNIIQKLEVRTAFEAYCKSKNLGWL